MNTDVRQGRKKPLCMSKVGYLQRYGHFRRENLICVKSHVHRTPARIVVVVTGHSARAAGTGSGRSSQVALKAGQRAAVNTR